uniref:Uncharacterized protein n=1 Tax=Theropithecus gelada TaxID=9565 RepID=A0A8D2E4P0_THEGE
MLLKEHEYSRYCSYGARPFLIIVLCVSSERKKDSTALRRGLALAECSSHKGSSQRMPYQPSAPRLPKGGQVWEEPYVGQLLGWGRDLSHH